MNRKVKLALAALLGFSTACSTVKNAPGRADETSTRKDGTSTRTEAEKDSIATEESARIERIMLMYGVPSPRPVQPAQPQDEQSQTPGHPVQPQVGQPQTSDEPAPARNK